MARVSFKGNNPPRERVKLQQGDFVYCEANGGASSFWGIYGYGIGVVSLDGAGDKYIPYVPNENIYLGKIYNYWVITKRIPCNNAKLTIEEIE